MKKKKMLVGRKPPEWERYDTNPCPLLLNMRANNDTQLTANLTRHVDRLAGLIGPRHLSKPEAFAAAAQLVERELTDAGYEIQRQTYLAGGQEVANIVAQLPGSSKKDESVIVGAHYDTNPSTPGADDNASAVAVMIEVARRMRALQPARTVRFVGFACEEMPYFHTGEMGSQAYARGCRARGERIRGMLCLEMVGYYKNGPGSQQVPPAIPRIFHGVLPKQGNFLAAVGNLRSVRLLRRFRRGFKRAVRFPLFSIALPEAIREIRFSDNSSFWDQGYPALMLTDTSFYRNPHYHMPTDTPDTLDYEAMAQVTLGVVGGACEVAGVRT
jgi:Zn-dependent M28 family amino/carboxypeptidase